MMFLFFIERSGIMREAIINEMTAVSDYIFRHPELSLNEYKSSGALADFLEKEGFRITWRLAGFETAFLAEWTVSGGRNRGREDPDERTGHF